MTRLCAARQLLPSVVVPEARVFHTLDALRGIAALGVLVFHMGPLFTPIAAPGGYLAVDLFFMMSGVVLSHAYEARFRAGMGTLGFMRARLIRLYPLYLAGAVFGIVVTFASLRGRNSQNWDPSSLSQAAALALFFLPNFSARPVNEIFPLNIPCWSLFFELVVNFLFVVLWPLLASRRLIVVCLMTGVAVGVAIAHTGNIDQGSTGSSFGVGLARTIFGFSVGVLISRHIPLVQRRQNNLGVLAIVAVVGIAIAGRPQNDFRALWDSLCVLLVFPLLVYLSTLIDPGSRLGRIATFLGVTSYAVYVLHSPLSSILNSATRFIAVGSAAPYMGLAVLAFLLAGCWLIDRYIDMPIRRHLSRIIPRIQASRA
jgi:peptidoglycan/LPS O-acetylase OafA/YrhL